MAWTEDRLQAAQRFILENSGVSAVDIALDSNSPEWGVYDSDPKDVSTSSYMPSYDTLVEQGKLVKVMIPVFDDVFIPGYWSFDYMPGWDARAHSMTAMHGAGEFTAGVDLTQTRSQVGIIIGLTANPQANGYGDVLHGYYIPRSTGKFGDEIFQFSAGVVGPLLGYVKELVDAHVTVDEFPGGLPLTLRRTADGDIVYLVGSHELYREDATPGLLWGTTSIYMGGTSVIGPTLSTDGRGSVNGTMQGLSAIGGMASYAQIVGTMSGAYVFGESMGRGSVTGSMSGILALAHDTAGRGVVDGQMSGLLAEAGQYDVVPPYAFVDTQMPGMWAYSTGDTTPMGGIDGVMSGLLAVGSHASTYAYLGGTMSGVLAAGSNVWADDEVNVVSYANVYAAMVGLVFAFAVIDAEANITGFITVDVIEQALIDSQATASDEYTLSDVLQAMIESVMSANDAPFANKGAMQVWALNTELNGATRYEGYDFNSFAEVGGRYYGAKQDGVYLLEGRTDDGTPVSASVNFGNLSFGTITRKAMPYVYAGVSSSGKLVLRVTADGQTFNYTATSSTELLKAHRFELGRGLRASYYDMTLMTSGEVFDLATIDFYPVELTRRL